MKEIGRYRVLALVSVLVSFFLVTTCAQTRYYTEEELGLRKETLYDEGQTVPVHGKKVDKEPGESARFERSFENSPPLIPHDITGMLPIALTENICLDCHMPEEAVSMGAIPLPKSHFVDLDTGEDLGSTLDSSRYNCMQCHVIQTIIPPAVKNLFKGEFRDEKSRYSSDLIDKLNEGVEVE